MRGHKNLKNETNNKRRIMNKKYRREIDKIMTKHNYTLMRFNKHMVWKHNHTSKMIVVSATPSYFHKSALMRTLQNI